MNCADSRLIAEGTNENALLEKTASKSFDRSTNVDIMFSLFSDESPVLPLQQEFISEGVETVYNVKGAGKRTVYQEQKRKKAELLREIVELETKLKEEDRLSYNEDGDGDETTIEGTLEKEKWLDRVINARKKVQKGALFGVGYQVYSKEVEKMTQSSNGRGNLAYIECCCFSDQSIEGTKSKLESERLVRIDQSTANDTAPITINSGGHDNAEANYKVSVVHESLQDIKSSPDQSIADADNLSVISPISVRDKLSAHVEYSDDFTPRSDSFDDNYNDFPYQISLDDSPLTSAPYYDQLLADVDVATTLGLEFLTDRRSSHHVEGPNDFTSRSDSFDDNCNDFTYQISLDDSPLTSAPRERSLANVDDATALGLEFLTNRRSSHHVEGPNDFTSRLDSFDDNCNDFAYQISLDNTSEVSNGSLESILGDQKYEYEHLSDFEALSNNTYSPDTVCTILLLHVISLLSIFGCILNRGIQLFHHQKQINQYHRESYDSSKLAVNVAELVIEGMKQEKEKSVSSVTHSPHKKHRIVREVLSVAFMSFIIYIGVMFQRETQTQTHVLHLQALQHKFALQALEIQQESRDKLIFGLMSGLLQTAFNREHDPSQPCPTSPLHLNQTFFDAAPTNNHGEHKSMQIQEKGYEIPMFDYYYVNSMLE